MNVPPPSRLPRPPCQALRQRTQGAAVLLSGHTEALWSAYKPLCRADGGLLGRLLRPAPGDVKSKVARIAFVNSDNIRRCARMCVCVCVQV